MFLRIFLLACCLAVSGLAQAAPANPALARQVNAFVDGWHDDAAHARMVYFDKMAPDGVFIGTDRGELWNRDAFREYGRKPFTERHRGWIFHATRRNVYGASGSDVVWFDELIDAQLADGKIVHYMSSGVLRKTAAGFEVVHYQLSFAVPNEAAKAVRAAIWPVEAQAAAQ